MNETNSIPQLTQAMIQYLDCPCRFFAPAEDDTPILKAYREARARGEKEGFLPMLVAVDETLWECLIMNSDGEDYSFDASAVAEYRRRTLAFPMKSGPLVLKQLLEERRQEAEDDDMDWDEEIMGEMTGGEANNRFCGLQDFGTTKTLPLILAEIPVSHPWEIFAWLPFGGWNECPDTSELMAVAEHWFDRYGAVPAVMTHDVLEFSLPAPVDRDSAMELALEHYVFCPDVVDQGTEGGTVGTLADTLAQSSVWFFWWD